MLETPPPPPAPQEHRFPCDTCGADLLFNPSGQNLHCDHCGSTQALAPEGTVAEARQELSYECAILAGLPDEEMEETRVLGCPNCGAQVELDGADHSAECPFCATPVVTDTGTHRHIKPRGVIPFQLEEREAHKAMVAWLGKLWFAPNGLKQYARQGRRLNGIYVPFWTFDADTASDYHGHRGDAYYVTRRRTRNGKTETYRERKIRWTSVRGHVARLFNDILVLASRSLPKRHTDALAPWSLEQLQPYTPQYLAGFRAEAYTVDLEDGYKEAREHMENVIRQDVRRDIGGDEQRISDIDTIVRDVTFKHVLLPVWTAAYKYRGTSYRFVVNAQSGRVKGERPYSAIKIAIAVFLGIILIAGAGYLISQIQ